MSPIVVRRSPTGVPYLADGSDNSKPPRPQASAIQRVFLFLAVFAALQTAWLALGGTRVERWVIDRATVATAAVWVRLLTPDVPVVASGPRLTAPGGGINVLKGCEGTDILFLLLAAFAVAELPWRHRMGGLLLGSALVYLLNQGRVVALFYAYRHNRTFFDLLHGTLGPLLLVALVGLYFFAWLHWLESRTDAGQAT